MPTKEYFFLISSHRPVVALVLLCRTVGWSENPGGSRNVVGINCPPLIEIGLIDLTKSEGEGGKQLHPCPLAPTALSDTVWGIISISCKELFL